MFQFNKLVLAGVLLAFTTLSEAKETVIIDSFKDTEFDIQIKKDGASHFIQFDSDELDSEDFKAKLDELPQEIQSKIKSIISNMHLDSKGMRVLKLEDGDHDGSQVHMFKVLKNSAKDIMVVNSNSEESTDLHKEIKIHYSDSDEHDKRVKILKFDFSDKDGDSEFNLIQSLLKETKLTPEQITQIQDVLNTK